MTKRTCFAALVALCVSFAFFSCAQLSSEQTASLSFSFSAADIRAMTGGERSVISRQSVGDDKRATLTVTVSGGGYFATQTIGFTNDEWTEMEGRGITGGPGGTGNRRQVPFSNVPVGVPITIRASFLNPWDEGWYGYGAGRPYTGEETVTLSGDASVNIQLKRKVEASPYDGTVFDDDDEYPI